MRGPWGERFDRGCGFWRGFVDERCAELLFRKKVLELLKDEGLLSEERERLLLSWRHRTGFSTDASVKVEPEDSAAVKRLARYMLRRPVSLERMVWGQTSDDVVYTRKPTKGQPGGEEHIDALDFSARVIAYIPEPRPPTATMSRRQGRVKLPWNPVDDVVNPILKARQRDTLGPWEKILSPTIRLFYTKLKKALLII